MKRATARGARQAFMGQKGNARTLALTICLGLPVCVQNVWPIESAANVVRMRSLLRTPSTVGVAAIWTYASSVLPTKVIFNASHVSRILLKICWHNWHVVCARGTLVVANAHHTPTTVLAKCGKTQTRNLSCPAKQMGTGTGPLVTHLRGTPYTTAERK